MSGDPRELARIQQWLQAVITHPAGLDAGLASNEASQAIETDGSCESVVLPSRAQSSRERLAVYSHAYFARLIECLGDQFPALRTFLGDDVFQGFALAYLRQYPSQSYTLGRLADRFVDFLERTRLEQFGTSTDQDTGPPPWSLFLVDLARLEHAIDQVFDGPGVERDPPDLRSSLSGIASSDWPRVQLVPVCCLRILEFAYPVNDFYTAYRQGRPLELPAAEPSYLALSRRDFVVRRYSLSRTQYLLLEQLTAGRSIEVALAEVAEAIERPEELAPQLPAWFENWTREGFFGHLRLAPGETADDDATRGDG